MTNFKLPQLGSPPPTALSKFLTTQARQIKILAYVKIYNEKK